MAFFCYLPGQWHHPSGTTGLEKGAGDEREPSVWVYLPRGKMNKKNLFCLGLTLGTLVIKGNVKWLTVFILICYCMQEYWQRPDGMPATREHLLMVLADLDDILIRASYHTVMRSSSISGVSMEIAVPHYTGLARAQEVEQCRCPPGYQGLSCQVGPVLLCNSDSAWLNLDKDIQNCYTCNGKFSGNFCVSV